MCGLLQQNSGEKPLRRGHLEPQNQVHNHSDDHDDEKPKQQGYSRVSISVSYFQSLSSHDYNLIKPRALTEQVLVDDVEADEEGSLGLMSA